MLKSILRSKTYRALGALANVEVFVFLEQATLLGEASIRKAKAGFAMQPLQNEKLPGNWTISQFRASRGGNHLKSAGQVGGW